MLAVERWVERALTREVLPESTCPMTPTFRLIIFLALLLLLRVLLDGKAVVMAVDPSCVVKGGVRCGGSHKGGG